MSNYCYVQNNEVVNGPKSLPTSWTDPSTGDQHSNLNALSDSELLEIGWYPYTENDQGRPGEYYNRIVSDFTIHADYVSRDVTYEQWAIDDVKQDKNTQLGDQITQYTTNEQAINPKVSEYINDDAKWLADEQAKLARLTDWNAVANFDTTKPMVLALPNSYIGAKNVRQGVALTSQNQAAVGSGLTNIWDQAEVDVFVADNQAAADDPSNSTAPVNPGFRLRQGVANVSEQFNRVVIYRFDRDDPNPAFQRSFAMQMTNRQDSRPLYVFTYTGVAYLTWHLFEDQGDGTWYWEASPAEWQYTDTDMGFIFSYGTNPAVEADYFTDRVEFPAGVEEDNLLVVWDPV